MKTKSKTILPLRELKVSLNFGDSALPIGRLAMRDRKIYFQYEPSFLAQGLEISPFRLPLKAGVVSFAAEPFEGLPGVFNDSLPDGWGRLLFDRFARSQGCQPAQITPLERLAHVGGHGLGALIYEPSFSQYPTLGNDAHFLSLDPLAQQAYEILQGPASDQLEKLLSLNGSSSGARPKALIGLDDGRQNIIHGAHDLPDDYAPWIVKFANTQDGADSGAIEYVYALMAKEAGLCIPDVHLFASSIGGGYFAVKRFDRAGKQRLHMHTACGLLHADYRAPSLDYVDLIALTGALTRDVREIEKMYQLAVFNVLAHNRDDHGKNFSFLMDKKGEWKLSPGYDLTFSSGPDAEQSTMVMGEGRNPSFDHLIKLGEEAKISKKRTHEIIDQTKSALGKWEALAKAHGVCASNITLIKKSLASLSC